MYNSRNSRSHPLTQQVPLTVSPFITLPTPPTLSYNYKPMPSALPPSRTGIGASNPSSSSSPSPPQPKPRYVVSPSGQAAHPTDIIASCRQLQAHLAKMQDDAERDIRAFEDRIRQRELAEKRRVAPGWLDTEERLLVPERARGLGAEMEGGGAAVEEGRSEMQGDDGVSEMADEGVELDRAFGGLSVNK